MLNKNACLPANMERLYYVEAEHAAEAHHVLLNVAWEEITD